MPSLLIPRRSDAHRLACLALYKALLRQCGRLPLGRLAGSGGQASSGHRRLSPLQELVRYRFRRDERLESFTAIAKALERGRVQLQVLDEANRGSKAARAALIKTLAATANHAECEAAARARQEQRLSRPATQAPAETDRAAEQQRRREQKQPPPDSIPLTALPLPLSQLRRRRRPVPYLNEAQGRSAILRWPGQHRFPAYLACLMRHKIKQFEKVHERRMELEYYVKLGHFEDTWDSIVEQQQQQQQQHDGRQHLSWSSAASEALVAQEALVRKIEAERGARGNFLWGVVKREQKLSDWETLPERLVRAAQRTAGIHLDLVRVAKRWGKHGLAARLFAGYQRRRAANARAAVELTTMYWVVPVEWARNVRPLALTADESQPSVKPDRRPAAAAAARTRQSANFPSTATRRREQRDYKNGQNVHDSKQAPSR